MIDMNGLFHTSAQKIYKYGEFKQRERLLGNTAKINFIEAQTKVFEDICARLEKIMKLIKPRKRAVLCIDGPAPLSKQKQMRQRRFISSHEKDMERDRSFDSNSITPGTKFMDLLSKYIDWYIRKEVSNENSIWSNIEIVFSNEKVPGEGEHKLINYIRKYGNLQESYCIHGMDADLIMLSLGTQLPNMFILRDEQKCDSECYMINIGSMRTKLINMLKWESVEYEFNDETAIYDFIFMCFTTGNDFLPHIPGIEIILGGIDFMIQVYRIVGTSYGHLTQAGKTVVFRKKSLAIFLATISQYEKEVFEDKLKDNKCFPDPLLNDCSKQIENGYIVDIDEYRKQHDLKHFGENIETVCHDYLQGMQWVLSYYIYGVPDWKWSYNNYYAPFAITLARHIKTFKFREFTINSPNLPFKQLLNVLPPKSSQLLPKPLDVILKSRMSKFCPDVLNIDYSGKRQKWEGILLLPYLDHNYIEDEYNYFIRNVDERDIKRNIFGKTFVYKYSDKKYLHKSYYGDFTSKVSVSYINI